MRPLLQPINTRKIQTILIQILQHICHKQDRNDPVINLSKYAFCFCGVIVDFFAVFVELVVLILMGMSWGDVVGS